MAFQLTDLIYHERQGIGGSGTVEDLLKLTKKVFTMEINTAITVGTSEVLLPSTEMADRCSLIIYNDSPNTIYLGGTGVTVLTGTPIKSGVMQAFDSRSGKYAIASQAGNNIRVAELK